MDQTKNMNVISLAALLFIPYTEAHTALQLTACEFARTEIKCLYVDPKQRSPTNDAAWREWIIISSIILLHCVIKRQMLKEHHGNNGRPVPACSRSTSPYLASGPLVSVEAYLSAQGASGGPALSLQLQWNNYEWRTETSSQEYLLYYLFSQSPGSGGENTYKLPVSFLSSSLKLLFAAQSRGACSLARASFHSFFFHSFFFWLFFLPRCCTGSIQRGPEALTQSSLPVVDALHLPSSLFFYLFSVLFFVFSFLGATQFYQRTTNKKYLVELLDAFWVSQTLQTFAACNGWRLLCTVIYTVYMNYMENEKEMRPFAQWMIMMVRRRRRESAYDEVKGWVMHNKPVLDV